MFKKISFYALILVTIISQSTIAAVIAGNEINIIQDDSSVVYHTVNTPIQVGTASKSVKPIRSFGLYQLYSDIDSDSPIGTDETVYNAGQPMNLLTIGGIPTTFIRRIDDFYNNCNYLWKGNLQFYDRNGLRQDQQGYEHPNLPIASQANGLVPNDGYNRIINSSGELTTKFSHHKNSAYHYNGGGSGAFGNSPMWYCTDVSKSLQDPSTESSYTLTIPTPGVKRLNPTDPNSLARVVIAFYDRYNGKYTDRNMQIFINGRTDYINCTYTGRGYQVYEGYFPMSWLDSSISGNVWDDNDTSNNKVEVKIKQGSGQDFLYDFTQIYIPTAKETDGSYLLAKTDPTINRNMLKIADNFSGELKFTGAKYAIDITTFGSETLIVQDTETESLGFSINNAGIERAIYLTDAVEKIEFGQEKVLERFDLTNYENVVIAVEDQNYFTKYDDAPEPDTTDGSVANAWQESLFGDVIAPWMIKSYSSNNYDVWKNYRYNGKTMLELQNGSGIATQLLKFEDIVDVYGGGIYSPVGITNLLRENTDSVKHVTIVGGTSVNYKKQLNTWRSKAVELDPTPNGQFDADTPKRILIEHPPSIIVYAGVPTGWVYGSQLGTTGSDDIFAVDNPKTFSDLSQLKRSVSRVVTFNDDDLRAWIDRRIDFKPSDNIGLWVGDNDDNLSFTHEQEKHRGKLPSVFLDINKDAQMGINPEPGEGIDNGKNNRNERSAAMCEMIYESFKLGYRLHIYQGHGNWRYLSNNHILDATEGYYINNQYYTSIPDAPEPSCYIWATCYAAKFHTMGYTGDYARSLFNTKPSMLHQLTKGTFMKDGEGTRGELVYGDDDGDGKSEWVIKIPTSEVDAWPEINHGGSATDKAPDSSKGVVNAIAATSLAEASWEDDFCNAFINFVRDNPDTTWGEAFIHTKKAVRYIQSNATYNLYGDPTLRVLPQASRKIEINNKSLYYKKSSDAIQVKLQGDWLNLENRPYNDTIYYTTKVNGVLTENKIGEINLSNYTAEEYNSGVLVDISTESFYNLTNYQLVFYSKENFRNLSNFDYDTTTVDTDSIITEWFISDKFTVDGIVPQTFSYYAPRFNEDIIDNRIVIEISHAIDNESGLAGYKYELTNSDTNETFYSHGGAQLTYDTSFIFAPYLSGFENMQPGHYTFQVYAYDKAGNERVMRGSGGVPINWKIGFDETDLDGDSIPDEWEEIYFDGDTDFITDANQDSDGDGISDYDEYYYGTNPYEITVSVKEGWNLLSIPCNLDQESIDKLAMLDSDMGYTYNATKQMYESESIFSNLSASTGYWYFSWSDLEDFTITGSPSKQGTEMLPTWNLIGPYATTNVSDHTTENDAIFSWGGSEFSEYIQLSNAELIYPAIGYWFFNGSSQSRSVILK